MQRPKNQQQAQLANTDEISVAETQKSKIEEEEEMQNDTIFDEVVT